MFVGGDHSGCHLDEMIVFMVVAQICVLTIVGYVYYATVRNTVIQVYRRTACAIITSHVRFRVRVM